MCTPKGEAVWPTHKGHPVGWEGPGSTTGRKDDWGQGNGRQGSWFTWPFRLKDHDPTCRWRRFCYFLAFK